LSGATYAGSGAWTLAVRADATGTVYDNGNVVITVVDASLITVRIRGELNWVHLDTPLSGPVHIALVYNGAVATLYVDRRSPTAEVTIATVIDESGKQIIDEEGNEIETTNTEWRISA